MEHMFYSVTFGDKNTWTEWGLIPAKTGKIEFVPPPVKEEYVDVPGMNGSLDMTEVLTGYPVYENREGSLSFLFFDNGESVRGRYTKLKNYLHGKSMRAVIEDDAGYYYEGRFFVGDIEFWPRGNWAAVSISYNVRPYKNEVCDSVEEWLWDPFSFETGVIRKYGSLAINGERTVTIIGSPKPTTPMFTVTGGALSLRFEDVTYSLPVGQTVLPQIVFTDGEHEFKFTGNGEVTVEFRGGYL